MRKTKEIRLDTVRGSLGLLGTEQPMWSAGGGREVKAKLRSSEERGNEAWSRLWTGERRKGYRLKRGYKINRAESRLEFTPCGFTVQ